MPANRGQGRALCRRVLAEHADTKVLLCSRDDARGEAAAAELRAAFCPARVVLVALDVADVGSVARARDVVVEALGGNMLAGLVSNAGVMWGHPRQEVRL